MKFNLKNLLKLKPFEEDSSVEEVILSSKLNLVRMLLIVLGFSCAVFSICSISLFGANSDIPLILLLFSATSSMTLSILEWKVGIKASALNSLVQAVFVIMCVFFIKAIL